ncbi:TetR/AcrR family transcriptional regulator [Crenobacter luteus]|uniref:TetR/AcrR family transcriptional regulator n=1 Tax=Crenobacter luteus TaxID=1452487 RepID=UPI0009EE6E3A|nr:TetR/AcrR family transcriptional regulator [Crenobacter luteus]
MARTKSPNFEVQRSAILENAAQLFAQKSFPSASIAQLAELCGMSKPLLYHYYRDKSHLLFDIADTHLERLIAMVDEVAEQRLDTEAHLKALIARFMEEYATSRHHHMVLVQDVKFLEDEARRKVAEKERYVVDAFARLIAKLRPELPAEQVKPVTMTLFGMMNWTFTWFRADGPIDSAAMAEIVSQMFLHGVYSPGLPGIAPKQAETPHEHLHLPENGAA